MEEKEKAKEAEASINSKDQGEKDKALECALLQERHLRLAAEFDNYKKRTIKEKEELCKAAEAKLMLRLLPIYEEANLAMSEAKKLKDEKMREGIMLILQKLKKAFESEGLSAMKLEGEKFDPNLHEAAMREESDAPEGSIIRVIRNGYLYKGEVLQHAIVSISSGQKPAASQKSEEEGEKDSAKQKEKAA